MLQKENLVNVILSSGEMRWHVGITKEAEQRALELLDKEKKPISEVRRTEIYEQAIEEFPVSIG